MNETLLSYIQTPNIIKRNSVLDPHSHLNQVTKNSKTLEKYKQIENTIKEQSDIITVSHKQDKKNSTQQEKKEEENRNEFKSFQEEIIENPKKTSKHIDIKV